MTDLIGVTGVAPAAAFSGVPTRGDVPLTVQFTDESTTASSAISAWAWDFGDGGTSSEQHPSHEYTGVGTFSISLTVTNAYGADTSARTDYITVAGVSPQASFTSDITSGESPVTVQFADQSIPGSASITGWLWDFGDGSATGTSQNPSHSYSVAGVYSVSLTVTTDHGSSTETNADYITVFANENEISGTVRDVVTDALLEGVLVELFDVNTGSLVSSFTTGSGGTYTVLPEDSTTPLRMRFAADGYDSREIVGITGPIVLHVKLRLTAPAAPEGVEAAAGAGEILVRWTANTEPDLEGYNVYRDPGTGTFVQINTSLITETTYQDTQVDSGIQYTYRVTAVDADANEGERSASVAATMGIIVVLLPEVSGSPGEVVRIPVNVANATGIDPSGMDVWLTYDQSLVDFTLDEPIWVERTALTSNVVFDAGMDTPGIVKIISLGQADTLSGEGHLFDIYLTLKGDAPDGECTVTAFDSVTFFDATPTLLGTDFADTGLLCVRPFCQQGDLNDDGLANSADVILALKASVGLVVLEACQIDAADMNGDGRIDSADALMIMRYSIGKPINPPQPGEAKLDAGDVPLESLLKQGETRSVQVASVENADLGATVVVPVTVDEAEGLTGLDLTFSYPYGEVALESVEAGSLTTDFTRSENQGDGFVRVSMSNPTPLAAGGGTLVELTFTVARTVAAGSVIPIKLNEAELKGQFGGSYRWYTDILKLDGTITVSAGAGEGEGATEGTGEGTTEGVGEGTTEGIGEGAGEGDDGGTGPGCAAAGLEGPGTHNALGDLMLLAVLGAGLLASGRGRRVDAKSMRYGKTRGIEAASPFN